MGYFYDDAYGAGQFFKDEQISFEEWRGELLQAITEAYYNENAFTRTQFYKEFSQYLDYPEEMEILKEIASDEYNTYFAFSDFEDWKQIPA